MKPKADIKRKKYNINRYARIGSIAAVVIIIAGLSLLLYKTLNNHKFVEKKLSLYSYRHKGKVNYSVLLGPNMVYSEKSLGEGKTYINDFIDSINATFKYDFSGERKAEIKGYYDIVGVLEGLVVEEKESKTVWKKEYVFIPKTSFAVNDNKFSVEKAVKIRLKDYNTFVEKIIKESNVNFDTKFTIMCNISLEANTDKGLIKEKMCPTMEVPLNKKIFEIKGNLSGEKEGSIEKVIKEPVPINRKVVLIIYIFIGICLCVLIFLLFFTASSVMASPFEKRLKKIFKLHGDRIVAIDNDIEITDESLMNVVSIEDLVRISDDICKPILYINISISGETHKFYVLDHNKVYLFELCEEKKYQMVPEHILK